jgi:L-fucose mutarotase
MARLACGTSAIVAAPFDGAADAVLVSHPYFPIQEDDLLMIKYQLLHPEILQALGEAGHGGQVLIADGNYPFSTRAYRGARRVYLNLAPDLLKVTDVLSVLVDAQPVESAHVMVPEGGPEPTIFAEFRALLPDLKLQGLGRFEFYDAALRPDLALVIATGERRLFANLLLTLGVVPPV